MKTFQQNKDKRFIKSVQVNLITDKQEKKEEANKSMSSTKSRLEDRPWKDLGEGTSTYQRLTEELGSKSIKHMPLQKTRSKRFQTSMRRVVSTASS